MSDNRENNLERLLRAIIDDFDQTGCSEGVGVVATSKINDAREYLGMEPLQDIDEGPPSSVDPEDESTP